jgi:hypothetical protein
MRIHALSASPLERNTSGRSGTRVNSGCTRHNSAVPVPPLEIKQLYRLAVVNELQARMEILKPDHDVPPTMRCCDIREMG